MGRVYKTTYRSPGFSGEFRLTRLQEAPADGALTDTPDKVAAYLRDQLAGSGTFNPDVENMVVVLLNTRRRIIGWSIISQGTLDALLVHPREIFKAAIVANASAIVVAHNHPSGDPNPSEADIRVTRDLIKAGQLLKIELLDHVILGQKTPDQLRDFCSLRELGYFYS